MARAVWLYYMAKVVELLDTVFFVLRKKTSQVSFLHVYHHSLMPVCAFVGVKYFAGGHGTLLGLINSFIHVLMYMYYMLSAIPSLQKFLWWKKYLTTLQIVSIKICTFDSLLNESYSSSHLLDSIPYRFLSHYSNSIPTKLRISERNRSSFDIKRCTFYLYVFIVLRQDLLEISRSSFSKCQRRENACTSS
jgi:hypothetical protein